MLYPTMDVTQQAELSEGVGHIGYGLGYTVLR